MTVQVRIGDPVAILGGAEPDSWWVIDTAGKEPVREGQSDGAGAVLTISDPDLSALVRGQLAAQDLYQRGKLRVDGDVTVAQRLGFLKGLV